VAWKGNGDQGRGRAVVQGMEYRFAGCQFGMRAKADSLAEYDLYSQGPDFEFLRTRGRAWGLPSPAKCYGFPDQVRAYYQNAGFLSDLELEFEELFSRVFYLGPLRSYPERQYTWAGAQPVDMGQRGERVVDALLAAREAGAMIARGRRRKRLTLEERVAMWLKDLGLIEHFEVRAVTPGSRLFEVWVQRSLQAPEVLITDVGFGVSQILRVITLCYYAPEGSTLLLEQPEIHLHPRVQAGLADVLIDAIKTRNIQIILESHSEHLLRRLQRRVAEEELRPEQAALYFCTMHQGVSHLEALKLDLFGNITNWPQDFFGDEMGDLVAMTEAAARRQQATKDRAE
jgi:predicted ATPase